MEVEPGVAWSSNASFTTFLILANEFARGQPFVRPEDTHAVPSYEAPISDACHGYVGKLSHITTER